MFKSGSLSRSLLFWTLIAAFVVGGISEWRSPQAAANFTNTVRDTGESGAGIIAGSAVGGGDKFDEGFDIASANGGGSKNN